MSDRSSIEWTEATWNPVTGCSKVSPGCAHCYAETLSRRFGRTTKPWTPEHALENVVAHADRLEQPMRWRRPRMIFVNSMSDLFHELVPLDFVRRVFDAMTSTERHTFQVLTKRPERALAIADALEWPQNVWLGVSIESSRFTDRADVLREIPAAVGLSRRSRSSASLFESGPRRAPLDLTRIDWLIAGGESGHGYRPVHIEWVRELREACAHAGVAFFFKQWGGGRRRAAAASSTADVRRDAASCDRLAGRLPARLGEVDGVSRRTSRRAGYGSRAAGRRAGRSSRRA